MRAMWSASSGMKSLQYQIDTVANNLANVNTTGFKRQRAEFQDVLYQKLPGQNFKDGEGKPVGIELGNGVVTSATTRSFIGGSMQKTENDLDFAVSGDGFFQVKDYMGNMKYTKDGSFKLSVADGSTKLVTTNGNFIQGDDGDLELGSNVASVEIDKAGNVTVTRNDSPDTKEAVAKISLYRFPNPQGLESVGGNLYTETSSSGAAAKAENGENGEIWQGYLEMSNVAVADEMINMITAQRAYELNVKMIQTADSMLQLANEIKR
jgi:flagellar basal-body rod protein FlgG